MKIIAIIEKMFFKLNLILYIFQKQIINFFFICFLFLLFYFSENMAKNVVSIIYCIILPPISWKTPLFYEIIIILSHFLK